jgi:hypothetical protein
VISATRWLLFYAANCCESERHGGTRRQRDDGEHAQRGNDNQLPLPLSKDGRGSGEYDHQRKGVRVRPRCAVVEDMGSEESRHMV